MMKKKNQNVRIFIIRLQLLLLHYTDYYLDLDDNVKHMRNLLVQGSNNTSPPTRSFYSLNMHNTLDLDEPVQWGDFLSLSFSFSPIVLLMPV